MITTRKVGFSLFLFLCFILIHPTGFAQKFGLEPDNWAIELAKGGLSEPNSMGSLSLQLMEVDSARALSFLDSCETAGKEKGYFFRAHFNMIKAKYLFDKFAGFDKFKDRRSKALEPLKAQIMQLHTDAIDASYHTEDDRTIGWASFYSAAIMRQLGETGWAVMYAKNGVDLFEKANYDVEPTVYTSLSELLFDVREYEESFANAQKAVLAWARANDSSYSTPRARQYRVRTWNTLALNYFMVKNYDSALVNFERALQKAIELKDTVWTGKVEGNIGRLLFEKRAYDSAYQLFKMDYAKSYAAGRYDNAANASEWAARANLARGNATGALTEARNALQLLALWPNRPFLRDTYYSLSQIFRAVKNYDSAFYYNDQYMALNDSLEKEIATSSLTISKAKLNDEVSQFNIQKLNRQKKTEVFWRNTIIAAILVIAFFALLMVNRKLLTEKIKKQKVERDKTLLELEMKAANEQLGMFTANIIEKNNLIAALEHKMSDQQTSAEHDAMVTTLGQLTILTEEDWSKFKQLYEKVYPGFFRKLIDQFPDITLAEQRMASLCKLRLSTQEMAGMLGISTDSVRKTRQRLRLRVGLTNDINLEDHFANL